MSSSSGDQPNLGSNQILKSQISLPSLEEQQKIVNILDKFYNLIKDIEKGIPREIELIKKEYLYYRNKLLIFKT